MWLEDEEIQERLVSGDAAQVSEALDAIHLRWESGDVLTIDPLRYDVLDRLSTRIDSDKLQLFVQFLLGEDDVPALDYDAALQELAKVVALYASPEEEYNIALKLKLNEDAPGAVRVVVQAIEPIATNTPPEHIKDLSFFLSSLLDGVPSVREAVFSAMGTWDSGPFRKRMSGELRPEISAGEYDRIKGLS